MHRRGLALGLLLALFMVSVADARPRRRRRRARVHRKAGCKSSEKAAKVSAATRTHAFFEVGAQSGLTVGSKLSVLRNGRRVGRCAVDVLSAGHGRCAFSGAQKGDLACFAPAVEAATEVAPASAGPSVVASAPGQTALASRLTTHGVPEVVDEAQPVTGALALRAEAELRHASFVRRSGGVHRETVRVWAKDVPLGFADLTANVDLSVLMYSARPDDSRYRTARAMLFVHETAVARRAKDGRLTLAVGRIRPWHAPGLPYLDGAQVGFRVTPHLEVGVLGGGVPDLLRLEPTLDRWMGGAYAGADAAWGALRLDLGGRAGVIHAPSLGTQGELEAGGRLGYARTFAVTSAARVRAGGDGVQLASLRAQVDFRPIDTLQLALDGRLRDAVDDPYSGGLPIVGADHGRASIRYTGIEGLSLGATGGVSRIRDDDLVRGVAGPEVGLPTLFGRGGGLFVGYQEAFGELPGRTGWVQARLRPAAPLQVWARLVYREDHPEAGPLREVGGFLQGDWRIAGWLSVRSSAFARVGLMDRDYPSGRMGLVLRASLLARL